MANVCASKTDGNCCESTPNPLMLLEEFASWVPRGQDLAHHRQGRFTKQVSACIRLSLQGGIRSIVHAKGSWIVDDIFLKAASSKINNRSWV